MLLYSSQLPPRKTDDVNFKKKESLEATPAKINVVSVEDQN